MAKKLTDRSLELVEQTNVTITNLHGEILCFINLLLDEHLDHPGGNCIKTCVLSI